MCMQAQSQNTGICQTCIYASECVHFRNSQIACQPIWFCENFDNRISLQAAENKRIYSEELSSQYSKPSIEAIPGRTKGLCINCEKRVSCQFPIQGGGVWYCEEYC
jgi:hypothetical protein